MTPPLVILILSLLLGMQPLTSDLYLPALPALTDSLGTTLPRAQLSLTALLLAFGVSQLVWGPLSDRFGRRPVVLLSNLGLGLDYIFMALAPTLSWLFVGRAISGITAASITTAGAYIADVTPADKRAAAADAAARYVGV